MGNERARGRPLRGRIDASLDSHLSHVLAAVPGGQRHSLGGGRRFGDWEFSQALDWSGIDYKGFDVVESAIAKARKFAKPNIAFFVGNVVELDLPPADLLLCKHMLQHLPTRDVQTFLKQLKNTARAADQQRQCGDDVREEQRYRRRRVPSLDPTTPPFNLYGAKS